MKLLRNEVSFGHEVKFACIRVSELHTQSVLHSPQVYFTCRRQISLKKARCEASGFFLVGEDGFEPSKRNAADLQSVPFGHSGTPPYSIGSDGAGRRTRLIKERLGLALAGNAHPRCILNIRVNVGSDRNGAGRRTRTPDLLITNQLLYRLSYTGVSNRTRLL